MPTGQYNTTNNARNWWHKSLYDRFNIIFVPCCIPLFGSRDGNIGSWVGGVFFLTGRHTWTKALGNPCHQTAQATRKWHLYMSWCSWCNVSACMLLVTFYNPVATQKEIFVQGEFIFHSWICCRSLFWWCACLAILACRIWTIVCSCWAFQYSPRWSLLSGKKWQHTQTVLSWCLHCTYHHRSVWLVHMKVHQCSTGHPSKGGTRNCVGLQKVCWLHCNWPQTSGPTA